MIDAALLRSMPVDAFLDALASRSPAPGGGAVAALALAQAASLAAMVVEYSVGKPALQAFDAALRAAQARLASERTRAITLMVEDAAAYAELNAALALPKSDPGRAERVAAAALRAVEPPTEVLDRAGSLIEALSELVPQTAKMLRSDLGVAGAMATAAAESGAWNIGANLPLLGSERERRERACGGALARAREARARLDAALEAAAAAVQR